MEKSWTLIRLDAHDAYMNMAIDEALLQFRSKMRFLTLSGFIGGIHLQSQ